MGTVRSSVSSVAAPASSNTTTYIQLPVGTALVGAGLELGSGAASGPCNGEMILQDTGTGAGFRLDEGNVWDDGNGRKGHLSWDGRLGPYSMVVRVKYVIQNATPTDTVLLASAIWEA